jgi:hypothetical protein
MTKLKCAGIQLLVMSIMFFHALLILCLGWVYPRSLLIGTDYNIQHFSFFLLLATESLRISE